MFWVRARGAGQRPFRVLSRVGPEHAIQPSVGPEHAIQPSKEQRVVERAGADHAVVADPLCRSEQDVLLLPRQCLEEA